MLEKDKWYKCSFSFRLKQDLEVDDDLLLKIATATGKVSGDGFIADIKIYPIE